MEIYRTTEPTDQKTGEFTLSQSMDHLVGLMEEAGIELAALDHGELTAIHSLLQDLLAFAAQGDMRALVELRSGLAQAKDMGFHFYSVQAVFGM